MIVFALKGLNMLAQGKERRVLRALTPPWVFRVIMTIGRVIGIDFTWREFETEIDRRSFRPRQSALGTRSFFLGRQESMAKQPRAAAKFVELTSLCPGLSYFALSGPWMGNLLQVAP
jgi:hypothetical protein